jgi:predicted DNA-binding ribbon-helix-helix protein
MEDPAREPTVSAIVTEIAQRTEPETDRLASMLRIRCWPGGAADRREPSALEWVRRWRPARMSAEPLDCSCARGRCAFCN